MNNHKIQYQGAEPDYRKEKQLPGPVFFKPLSDYTLSISRLEVRLQSAPSEFKYLFRDAIESLTAKSELHKAIEVEIKNSRIPALILHDVYVQHGGESARIDFLMLMNRSVVAVYSADEKQRSVVTPDIPRDFDENLRALAQAQQSTYILWKAMRESRKIPSKVLGRVYTFVVSRSSDYFDGTPRDFSENSLIYNEIRQSVGVVSSDLSGVLKSLYEKDEKPLFRVKQQYAMAEWLSVYSEEVSPEA
ncbi:MAG: hypothetical protein GXY06_00930 [Clostridiaceae bacterium]|nr:hypothetical protein [Clostridiaceae bacterium]